LVVEAVVLAFFSPPLFVVIGCDFGAIVAVGLVVMISA
jgi:hypothetical protein